MRPTKADAAYGAGATGIDPAERKIRFMRTTAANQTCRPPPRGWGARITTTEKHDGKAPNRGYPIRRGTCFAV